jgi:methionyl aminopeptidase
MVKLVDTALAALMNGIATCRPGSCLSEIGAAIEKTAHDNGLVVVKDFYGHGTGPILHMAPLVAHFANKDFLTLRPGMVFTIEPVIAEGSGKLLVWDDGWSAATVDGGRGAQFEHEVLITEKGHEILTVIE